MILGKIDDDRDGSLKVEDVMKVRICYDTKIFYFN